MFRHGASPFRHSGGGRNPDPGGRSVIRASEIEGSRFLTPFEMTGGEIRAPRANSHAACSAGHRTVVPLFGHFHSQIYVIIGDIRLISEAVIVLLAERLGRVATEMRLDQADLARILGASPRTVARWLQAETAPRRDTRERILELVAVLNALSKTVHGQTAYDWLYSPIPALEHRKPADLLAEGRYREVLGAVDALAEGVFV